jgi:hypothetical protein
MQANQYTAKNVTGEEGNYANSKLILRAPVQDQKFRPFWRF